MVDTAIEHLDAFMIFDSRGVPTVEVELTLRSGIAGRGLVPSGASTGQFEALELRDGDPTRFRGKGVEKAITHVRDRIGPLLAGHDGLDQEGIDRAMIEFDATPDKSNLGANAILGVSLAAADAAARARGLPLFESLGDGNLLPVPEIQIFGGGAHADWRTDIQDYLIIATGATTYAQTLQITFDIYHAAGELMKQRGGRQGVADEGGHWPNFDSNEAPMATLVEAIEHAGYTPGRDAMIALDVAASDLFKDGLYHLRLEGRSLEPEAFTNLIERWCADYPILSVEDPAADTDEASWHRLRRAIGDQVQLVGDDLFTTNRRRIEHGIEQELANAVLIKLNQIGTVTETVDAIRLTQAAGWTPIVSARSGETEDAFISHLAVATNAGQLKVGSFARSERMVKWNEVIRIARALGNRARFEGMMFAGPQ